MALRRRQKREVPRAGPFPPGWDVPAAFNFTRDVVEAWGADPLRSALTFVDTEGIVDRRTFAEVAADAARWAHLLRTRVNRGDRVMIVVGKVPAWHGAMLGAIKGGLVAVPCPNMLRARDLAFRVRHSGARLVIADRELEPEIEEMRNQIGDIVAVLYVDEALAELTRYRPVAPTEVTTAGETALILYTSGTTKEAKGVVHTHAYTWAQRQQAGQWLDARERDVVWCTAGTGWAKAIWNVLLGPWSHGAEVVLHQNAFEPEERLSLVQRLGVSVLCQAPTEYRMLAKLDNLATTYLPKLRHAVSAGEPLNPEVIATFQDALGVTVHDGYGQTENSLLVANIPGAPIRPGSMGLPTEGHDVAVIDEVGNVCASGVEGDIALIGRPPTLFRGYWNDPEETESVYRDAWYVTGDRATRDEQGYLWFVGRTDDVILSAAYRIGPFEVESALLEHPAVAESAVVGIPDADRGQIVKAYVVLRPGHEPGNELAVELQDHVKAVTAPYKYPRSIAFVEELPKTSSGKIRRAELREAGEAIEAFTPSAVVVPLRAVPDLEPAVAEQVVEVERHDAETTARHEAELAERARVAAEEAARIRAEAEAAARRAAEEAERARIEAEESALARAEEERIRREADEAERLRAEADAAARARAEADEAERLRAEAEAAERARAEAEEAERLRAEAEAAARARLEAEEQARREAAEAAAAERARAEAEAAERMRAEVEVAEQARREEAERLRAEAEAAERARAEAEAADQVRREAEEAERQRAEAEAAERARAEAEEAARLLAEAEEAARREAEEVGRREAEADERARMEAVEAGMADVEGESWRDARRRKRELEARLKTEAEAAKRRAKEEAEQRKHDEAAAREDARRRVIEEREAAKQRLIDEKAAAKQRVIDEKRRAEEEKIAAKQHAEDERRREADEKVAAKQFAEDERRRAKAAEEQRKRDEIAAREEARRRQAEERESAKLAEDAKRRKRDLGRRRGLGRLLPGDEPEDDYGPGTDDDAATLIPDIVERLQRYSGVPGGDTREETDAQSSDGPAGSVDLATEPVAEVEFPTGAEPDLDLDAEHVDERRSAP